VRLKAAAVCENGTTDDKLRAVASSLKEGMQERRKETPGFNLANMLIHSHGII
jgi:hypothetical protein